MLELVALEAPRTLIFSTLIMLKTAQTIPSRQQTTMMMTSMG